MNKILYHFVLLSLLTFTKSALAQAPYLEGAFEVAGGQATYDIAIDVPPGRAGHQPTLSINYHSGRGNGTIGVGWALNGVSSINRCARNLSIDGKWGGIKLNADDRYCVDGKRLIAITGMDGSHLTEYRTELDDGNKYVSFNQVGSGPQYFKVWTPNGNELTYGGTADSRLVLSGHAYSWGISANKDKSINNITYKYIKNGNTQYIDTISYLGGKVKFNYENRSDYFTRYLLANAITKQKRLTRVVAYDSTNAQISEFKLAYKAANESKRSLVTKVSKSYGGISLKPIDLTWSENTAPSHYISKKHDGSITEFFDKTRDGKLEYLSISKGRIKRSDSSATYDARNILGIWDRNSGVTELKRCETSDVLSCNTSDVNNDGINEIATSPHYDLNGDGKTQATEKNISSSSPQFIDLNGDGLMDSYTFISGHDSWTGCGHKECQKSKSYSYLELKYFNNEPTKLLSYCSGNACWFSENNTANQVQFVYFFDLNNDGYKDLLYKYVNSDRYYLRLNDGVKFKEEKHLFNHSSPISQVIDLNGDGLNEIVLTDGVNKPTNIMYLSPTLSSINDKKTVNGLVKYVDLNSDGELDKIETQLADKVTVKFAQKSSPRDKITAIKTYAGTTMVNYLPIADTSVHTQKLYFEYPVINTTPTLFVVQKVNTPNGETTYQYAGAKSHVDGGGFLGFNSITSTHTAGGIATKVISKYEQYKNVGGKVKKLPTGKLTNRKEFKNNKLLSEEWRTYNHVTQAGVNGVNAYRVSLSNSTVQLKDEHGADLGKTTIAYNRNTLGRITKETITKSADNNSTFVQTTDRAYLSSGSPTYKVIYQAKDNTSNTIARKLAGYENLDLWCGKDNKKYVKPRNKFVLIHGEIDTPIMIGNYPYFYRLDVSSTTNNAVSNIAINTTSFTTVNEASFNAQSPQLCGEYYVNDFNGDGLYDIVSNKGSLATLVTEAGNEFWKTSAPHQMVTTLTSSGESKKTTLAMNYSSRGLLLNTTTDSTSYDGGSGSKSLFTRYQYDSYGNVVAQTQGGTNTQSRTARTEFDSQGLFPLISINPQDHRTAFQYDKRFGNVTKVTDPNNRSTQNQYDVFGRVTKTTIPGSNNWSTYEYLLGSACPSKTARTVSCIKTNTNQRGVTYTQFDFAGREVRSMHQAFDGRWVYVDQLWDINGRKTRHSRPSFTSPDSAINNVPHSRFTYDLLNREVYKQEPSDSGNGWHNYTIEYRGFTETIKERKQNKDYKKSITKNVMGYVINTTEPMGAHQNYTYYPDGKLKTTTDAAGNKTTIQYDNLGYRNNLDDPDLGIWTYDYNVFGELVYKRDANGNVTTIDYDVLGRKKQENIAGRVSTWSYDTRGKGLLYKQTSPGNTKEFFYRNGLLIEEKMVAKGQTLVQRYDYDGFERLAREVRPNSLTLEYIYNQYGYQSAVRSPKEAADDIFTSETFQQDVRALISDSIKQAQKYLDLANRYAQQRDFYNKKANELSGKSVDVNQPDSQSWNMLNGAQRFKKYCNASGTCYLQPATWVILHDDVAIPLDINLDGYYRLANRYRNTVSGNKYFDTTLHTVSAAEFANSGARLQDEWVVKDHDGNGSNDLISKKHVYGAYKDSATQVEINFTAQDLELASRIANARYKTYRDLASNLVSLSKQVATLSQLLRTDVNDQNKQKQHLQTILTQSELAKANKSAAYIYYWQRTNTDAYDHTTSEVLGNGLANSYAHSQKTGRARVIATHKASSVVSQTQLYINRYAKNNYRYLRYDYDNWSNVTRRYDMSLGLNETFTYDLLDRVTSSTPVLEQGNQHGVNNPDFDRTFEYRYDKLGNITHKTDVGDYRYQSVHKHAVTQAGNKRYQYDAVGNMVKGTQTVGGKTTVERELVWTDFNKPARITRNDHTTSFEYDANQQRFYREDSTGLQTLYLGKRYEQVIDTKTKMVQHKQYIYADGKLIALNIIKKDSKGELKDKQVRYMHYDALQSVDMITDGYGLIVERRSYDAWGKTRKLLWQDDNNPATLTQFTLTNRGFTGHEHLEEVGLIHMNGRVYDQELGRFISADPFIQAPYMTNSFNRYAYVMNNPMKYVDPTGYWFEDSNGNGVTGTCNTDGTTTNGIDNGRREGQSDKNKSIDWDSPWSTVEYIGNAIGGLFGGPGNISEDQIEMKVRTRETLLSQGKIRQAVSLMRNAQEIFNANAMNMSQNAFERFADIFEQPTNMRLEKLAISVNFSTYYGIGLGATFGYNPVNNVFFGKIHAGVGVEGGGVIDPNDIGDVEFQESVGRLGVTYGVEADWGVNSGPYGYGATSASDILREKEGSLSDLGKPKSKFNANNMRKGAAGGAHVAGYVSFVL